jgi:SAM-dependent methyltransferase
MHFSQREVRRNLRQLAQRERTYRAHGYDLRAALRFVLTQACPLPRRVLEIGTGKGRFLVGLARRVDRIVTVDPDAGEQTVARAYAAHANVGHRIRFLTADGARLPFADGSFAAVASFNALHHFRDLDRVLDEILRVTAPGGTIVLADLDSVGFRIFRRILRAENREHERIPYRWPHVSARLRVAGYRVRIRRGDLTVLLLAHQVPGAGPSRQKAGSQP